MERLELNIPTLNGITPLQKIASVQWLIKEMGKTQSDTTPVEFINKLERVYIKNNDVVTWKESSNDTN